MTPCLRTHDFAKFQQPRTDLDSGALCGTGVDFKPDLVSVHHKTDRAALPREAIALADGENVRALKAREDFAETPLLRLGNKNELAILQVFEAVRALDADLATPDVLTTADFVQRAAQRIVAEDADGERRVGI